MTEDLWRYVEKQNKEEIKRLKKDVNKLKSIIERIANIHCAASVRRASEESFYSLTKRKKCRRRKSFMSLKIS